MSIVIRIIHIETSTTIWEFDPTLTENQVLSGSLDVIAALQTLVIKIQLSGQCVAYFKHLQHKCGIENPFKIPLHTSNVHCGTADGMLVCAFEL